MQVGRRNAGFVSSGKVGKITWASQFGEIICQLVLEYIPSSILPSALVADNSFLFISILRKHTCLIKAEAGGIFNSSTCFPSSAPARSEWEGGRSLPGTLGREDPLVARGLCVVGREAHVGAQPRMDGKSTELCPQPAMGFRGCPKKPSSAAFSEANTHPASSQRGGAGLGQSAHTGPGHPRSLSGLGAVGYSASFTKDDTDIFRWR